MKASKIIWFEDCSEETVNRRLKVLETRGWEVVSHQLDLAGNAPYYKKYISVLLQKEKEAE